MFKLPLAVEIADTILSAARSSAPLDIDGSAELLARRYGGACISKGDIIEALRFESEALGLTISRTAAPA